ncbi:DNA helicase [Tanacetum coccineum]
MHTTMVLEQVKTQKIQAEVQVSRPEDKDVIFSFESALEDFILLYFVLVRNIFSVNKGDIRLANDIVQPLSSRVPNQGHQSGLHENSTVSLTDFAYAKCSSQCALKGLIELLDNHNALVQLFRTARNKYMEADILEFKVKLYNVIGSRQYELPTADTIRAIVFGGNSVMETEFDLIIEENSEGYQKDMKLLNVPVKSTKADKRMSMNIYYPYQIHDRLKHYTLLSRGGELFQQYVVTAYCAIEQSRLDYIRQKQSDIRNEYLSGLYDSIMRGDRNGSEVGMRTVLTASFTGGPRYMYAHYLDALSICHGNPSFFVTYTCNAKWLEIQDYMASFPELTTVDRADVVDRLFEQKVRDYIKFVRNTKPFGDITAVLYTIEFQRHGLPHYHSFL